ncbi:MAG: winged helix-turn-helix transcriptional regulator [Aestuariivirgaceae bacterium]
MAGPRRYKLLCPIARALDRVGDRWTLLILRDLHAGPARFSDLQNGLTGIAPNLLTDRLQQLIADGLAVKKSGDHGLTLYALTELGTKSRDLLFELAMFGGRFEPDEDRQRPGNLRTIAVTLGAACQRVVTPDLAFEAELNVDGELFMLAVKDGAVDMRYAAANSPDVVMTTSYEPMIAAAEGELPMNEFLQNHVEINTLTLGKDGELMALLGGAMQLFHNQGA